MTAYQTSRLGLFLIAPSQAQKHVTHNEALTALEGVIHLSVRALVPELPQALSVGERIALSHATGEGAANDIAEWTQAGWTFLTPRTGWIAHVEDEGSLRVFAEAAWRPTQASAADRLGINTKAMLPSRLTVRSAQALFHAEEEAGGDCRIAVSKSAMANTASVLFQTGFSGRAEFGLTGTDAFALKVSEDGINWLSSLVASPYGMDLRTADRTRLHFTSEGHLITSLNCDVTNVVAAFSVRSTFQMNNTSAGSGVLLSR